jgi:hypothetical protein
VLKSGDLPRHRTRLSEERMRVVARICCVPARLQWPRASGVRRQGETADLR